MAWRAAVALVLMVGFYALAVAVAWGLAWLPYAEWRYADRLHPKLALFCLVGAFLILKSILPRRDKFEPPGPRLMRGRDARLFGELQQVAGAAEQPMPEEVYLIPDVNAWVSQRGGVMGFGGRRVMALGLPLLQVLSVSELRAVIAHEFGHYHGGDVKLGPWVYKTRQALARTLQALAGHSGMLAKPFEWYGALFLRVTHAVSRGQELQADALAARIAGSAALARGLRRVHGAGLAFQPYWAGEVDPVLSAGFLPPLADGFGRFVEQPAVAEKLREAIDTDAREGKHDPYDSHPSLRERLAALGTDGGAPATGDPPALTLLEGLPALEKDLLTAVADADSVGRLKPVSWEEVGSIVYVPRWQAFVKKHASALAGITPGALATFDWTGLGQKLAAAAKRKATDGPAMADFAIGASLAVALIGRGFVLEAPPGAAVTVRQGDQVLEPFAIRKRLATGSGEVERWRAFCDETSLSGLDLGSVA
jgi:Zn-dependent protease with chaperone function